MRAWAAQALLGFWARERWILSLAASSLACLGERHAMMCGEPPIVAVVRRKAVEKVDHRALGVGTAGAADQAVGERGRGERQRIARPRIEVDQQCGEGAFGVAGREQFEKRDMAGLPVEQAAGGRLSGRQ